MELNALNLNVIKPNKIYIIKRIGGGWYEYVTKISFMVSKIKCKQITDLNSQTLV